MNDNLNVEFFEVNGTAFWAKVQKPDQEGKYSMDLIPLTQEDEAILLNLGLKPAMRGTELKSLADIENGIEGPVFHLKRTAFTKTGEKRTPPQVLDSEGTPVNVLLGNGSVVRVSGTVRDYDFKGKKGRTGSFHKVEIGTLVPYKPKYQSNVPGGFKASSGQVKEIMEDNSEEDADIDVMNHLS